MTILSTVRISGIVSVMRTKKPKTLEPAKKAENQHLPFDENEKHDDETLAKLYDRKTALEKLLRDRKKELYQFLVENGSVDLNARNGSKSPMSVKTLAASVII